MGLCDFEWFCRIERKNAAKSLTFCLTISIPLSSEAFNFIVPSKQGFYIITVDIESNGSKVGTASVSAVAPSVKVARMRASLADAPVVVASPV